MSRALVAVQPHVLLSYALGACRSASAFGPCWPMCNGHKHTHVVVQGAPLPHHFWDPLARLQQLVRTDSACRWTGTKPCVHTLGLREGESCLVSTCQSSQAHEHNNHVCTPGGPMTLTRLCGDQGQVVGDPAQNVRCMHSMQFAVSGQLWLGRQAPLRGTAAGPVTLPGGQ